MRAFVDTVETKEQALAAMQAHYDADRIVQNVYHNSDGRGCAVGCHYYAHNNNSNDGIHAQAERVHGIPRALARLEDTIFEGLNKSEAREWPLQYLTAINVGSDLSQVTDKFVLRMLEDEERGVIAFVKAGSYVHSAVARVIDLYRRKLVGEHIKKEEWAASAAASANAYNAYAYAATVAAYAATAAAAASANAYNAYAYAATVAAYAATAAAYADTAASVDARKKHYAWMRDVLIDIIRNTK